MAHTPHPRIGELLNELETVAAVVAAAQSALAAGSMVDLRGLEERVAQLCEGLAALPPADCAGFSAAMAELVAELDNLARAVQAQRDEAARDADGEAAGSPAQAARAYGRKPPPTRGGG
ncbi:MAG: hypothetical protein FJX52_13675 [Alphaproteobacteria bacterium]|nr:hypothetical protein [Alphaproteobacteria bacterium]